MNREKKIKVLYVLIDHNLRKNSYTEAIAVKRLLKKFQINLVIIKNKKRIKKNMFFMVDGKPKDLNYLGHEVINSRINSYFEIMNIKKIETIEIKDTSLLNYFDTQENLTYFEIDNQRFTLRLRKNNVSKKIEL